MPEIVGHSSEFLSFLHETGYLEPESHCLVQSSLAGNCFVCIVHKRKTRWHNYKQSLRHQQLSGTALQIVEDGFQSSVINRELVLMLGNGGRRGQDWTVQRCSAEHGLMLEETWEHDLRWQVGRA